MTKALLAERVTLHTNVLLPTVVTSRMLKAARLSSFFEKYDSHKV
jgi:hypothetical protein